MDEQAFVAALELTAAMTAAADCQDWEALADLAGERHAQLEAALAGDAWRDVPGVVEGLRAILETDQQLAARASAARQQTVQVLGELRGGSRMRGAYAVHAVAG